MYQYHHITKVANVRNLDLGPATDQLFFNNEAGLSV